MNHTPPCYPQGHPVTTTSLEAGDPNQIWRFSHRTGTTHHLNPTTPEQHPIEVPHDTVTPLPADIAKTPLRVGDVVVVVGQSAQQFVVVGLGFDVRSCRTTVDLDSGLTVDGALVQARRP